MTGSAMTQSFFKAIQLDEIDNSFEQELLDNFGNRLKYLYGMRQMFRWIALIHISLI